MVFKLFPERIEKNAYFSLKFHLFFGIYYLSLGSCSLQAETSRTKYTFVFCRHPDRFGTKRLKNHISCFLPKLNKLMYHRH